MTSENIFIGRQPILDADQNIIAFELLFRKDLNNFADVTDNLSSTARVLVNLLNNIGINKLLGRKLAFININEEIIKKDILKTLQKDRFVLEILETTKIDYEIVSIISSMHEEGYTFALDDFVFNEENIKLFSPLFDKITYIKVDIKMNQRDIIASKFKFFKTYPIDYLAEKIENMEEFYFYKNLGFKLFQGYFFAKPTIIRGKGLDPRRMAIFEIINQIYKDVNIEVLEKTFKKYPEMTINLLQFINSAAIGNRSRIESVRQALALLGHRQLLNWMILMEYAFGKGPTNNHPLLFSAIERAKTMELLMKSAKKDVQKSFLDEAYLTGLLSLLDVLFQIPMSEILTGLNLSQDIIDALLEHKNVLGRLLLLVKKHEENNFQELASLLKEINMPAEIYSSASLEGFSWAQENADQCWQGSKNCRQ